jgi:cytochrome c biogenesis protein CcdA
VAGQIGVLGLVFMLSCAVVYLLVGSLASAVLNARPAAARAVSLVSSVAMIIIGAVLLVEHLAAQRRSTGQWRRPAG